MVSKTESESNAIKLERTGADVMVACHDVGGEVMVEVARKEDS